LLGNDGKWVGARVDPRMKAPMTDKRMTMKFDMPLSWSYSKRVKGEFKFRVKHTRKLGEGLTADYADFHRLT